MTAIEQVAQARAEAHKRAEDAKKQRRKDWEAALPKARVAYLAVLNRGRLDKQLEAYKRATELRTYADAVTTRATTLASDQRGPVLAWAEWIRAEADRHDPTRNGANLRFAEPAEIATWELDKYMPQGFTASGPPD